MKTDVRFPARTKGSDSPYAGVDAGGSLTLAGSRFRLAGRYSLDYAVVFLLVAVVIALAVLSPAFFRERNLSNITGQWAEVGLLAIAATFVIIAGGFDISMGATYAFCTVVTAGVGTHHSAGIAYLAALGVGLVVGLTNGLIIQLGGINPFVATLGTSFIITGVGFAVTDAKPFYIYDDRFALLGTGRSVGLPNSGILLIACFVVFGMILSRTVYGRSLYAVGGNTEAARLAGIKVNGVMIAAYAFSGLSAGAAGLLSASRIGAGQMTTDITILFDAITVVIIGGTSLAGGVGALWRTAVGLAILACLGNGFNQLNLSPYLQDIIIGGIVLLALGLDRVLTQFRRKGLELK